ncbi:hypothetical protein AYI70_g5545 [Smittium culicis]|uniref:Uncharacterized protein n=1 Tax=Smittium culicis TaxID=133412 RepID=A0A1R1XTZ2_9FUNG|nr:hypothetical protein AYI70_g5545 [Smittium culicis]
MTINIKKSAYIGPSGWKLFINDVPLPTPKSYKYLGLPVTVSGIDWESFVKDATIKSANMLKFLQVKGNNWPPITRLTLYKSYVRSCWEYAAPLMALTLKSSDIELIEKEQLIALAWVIGISVKSGNMHQRMYRSLKGIESIKDRFETLLVKFGIHVSKCSVNNPSSHFNICN